MTLVRHEGQLHNPAKGPCKDSPLEGSTKCRGSVSSATGAGIGQRADQGCLRPRRHCLQTQPHLRPALVHEQHACSRRRREDGHGRGGWKSPSVFLGTYVNPHNDGRLVAERLKVY